MYANESDEILVNKFRSGDNKSFDAILLKYQQRVFSYIFKMVKDQDLTNDIFQEVFIKVITSLKKDHYNHEGKLLSWILRIAHNQVIDHFRKDSKMPGALQTWIFETPTGSIRSSEEIRCRTQECGPAKPGGFMEETRCPAEKYLDEDHGDLCSHDRNYG